MLPPHTVRVVLVYQEPLERMLASFSIDLDDDGERLQCWAD